MVRRSCIRLVTQICGRRTPRARAAPTPPRLPQDRTRVAAPPRTPYISGDRSPPPCNWIPNWSPPARGRRKGDYGRLFEWPSSGTVLWAAYGAWVATVAVVRMVNQVSLWPSSSTSCFSSRTHLLISEVSFEGRGGDLVAVMATSEQEGSAVLDLIAGKRSPLQGDVLLNGQRVRADLLKCRVAYAQGDPNLCMDMTAVQIMRFHYDLRKPTEKLGYLKIDSSDRINLLIEELGLEQVRNTKVSSMTISERRRLNVACHLLQDTDIVVLDQPTRGMDIFDTFFLVEYLRQWANGGAGGSSLGRIVILTLHPPTYEIFMMLSRILLLSAGRMMFSGRRREMLPYFALVDYPCPNFKNPSDYYLDLVTLDDLSAEAMLESSQRCLLNYF